MLSIVWFSMAALADPPPAVVIKKETAAYSYEFGWSREAKAVAALDQLLRAKAKDSIDEFTGEADQAYRESRKDQGGWFPDVGYQHHWSYETAGQSKRLLSLSGSWYSYTGGAHGIFGANALLWDRQSNKTIELADLFDKVTEFAMLHPAMCMGLNRHRAEKREGETLDTEYPALNKAFNGCPKYEELTIWVSDEDRDGRFDRFNFSADPYVAGPYVEGSYDVSLPVSKRLLRALRPEYRPSFEAQGVQ